MKGQMFHIIPVKHIEHFLYESIQMSFLCVLYGSCCLSFCVLVFAEWMSLSWQLHGSAAPDGNAFQV